MSGTEIESGRTMRPTASLLALALVACASADTSSGTPRLDADEALVVDRDSTGASIAPYASGAPEHTDPMLDSAAWLDAVGHASYLVWGEIAPDAEEDDDLVAVHARPEGGVTLAIDSEGHVLGRAAAAYVATSDRVLRFEVTKRRVRRERCAVFEPPAEGEPSDLEPEFVRDLIERSEAERRELLANPFREVDEAAFVDGRTGRRQVVAQFVEQDVGSDFQFVTRLRANVGSLVFLHTWEWSYLCGAHGSGGTRAEVFDLATLDASPVALLDTVDAKARAGALVLAEPVFAAQRAEWGGDATEETAEPVAVEPRYRSDGSLEVRLRFATFAPYAFSTAWSSYSMDALGLLPTRPPALASAPNLPEVVLRVAQAEPRFTVRGFSALRRE